MAPRMRRASLALVILALTGCAAPASAGPALSPAGADFASGATSTSSRLASVDGPLFGSVRELATAAELVVIGTFAEPLETTNDGALSGAGQDAGLPLELWSFRVSGVLRGDPSVRGSVIRVAQYDFTRIASADLSNVASPGASAALFLRGYADGETYGVVGTGQGAVLVTSTGALQAAPNAVPSLAAEVDDCSDLSALAAAL